MAAATTTECTSSATQRGRFLPPLPLAGGAEQREAGGGSFRESQRRESPHPNPPPQAGEGAIDRREEKRQTIEGAINGRGYDD
jgi:hypothetical protein